MYVFAEKYGIADLRDFANRLIVRESNKYYVPSYDLIIYAFEHLRKDNPILKWLVDMFCKYANLGPGEHLKEHLPYDFLLQGMLRYTTLSGLEGFKETPLTPSDYYETDLESG
jgi:hypothetical protein